MSRRSTYEPTLVPDWYVQDEFKVSPRRTAVLGSHIKIKGERGWFTFVRHVLNLSNGAEWVDCIHLTNKSMHSFRPDRVTRMRVQRRKKIVT